VCFLLAAFAFVSPRLAAAQMQPHHAEYALRLGPAVNAPRIGTAVQDLTRDCSGWHLKRDITTEIALTASWKLALASKLDGEESSHGRAFHYRLQQTQNGNGREIGGRVERADNEMRAEIVWPSGPQQFTLPGSTLLPISAINYMIDRLRSGAGSFPALTFDSEVIGDAFLVDVTQTDEHLRAARPDEEPIAKPPGKAWPVFMTFTRGRQQQTNPLFSVSGLVFDSGVLDRLSIDTGLVQVTADLKKLQMYPKPACPRS
jgi:hypothetical protein